MDNTAGLLAELLDAVTAVHMFLSKDLAKDKLSSKNHKARNSFVQQLDQLLIKIRSAKEASTKQESLPPHPVSPLPRPVSPLPSQRGGYPKPPAPLPQQPAEEDEGGELYELPEQKPPPDPSSEYSSFLPVTLDDGDPQEEYLAMEADQKEIIDEEMYEDPSQTPGAPPTVTTAPPISSRPPLPPSIRQPPPISPGAPPLTTDPLLDEEPGLYEDPVMQTTPTQPMTTPPTNVSGYMDPVKLSTADNRKSVVPVELIDDWESVYDDPSNRKKEKIKVSKLKNVTIKGWLEKLGGRSHKNWQKRYCVLSELFMYFYEKEGSATYNNRIPIPGFVPNPSTELSVPKKSQYVFKLSSTDSSGKSKDYYFRTKSEQDRDNWVAAIRIIFEQSRVAIEKRKSFTLPATLSGGSLNVPPSLAVPDIPEQEEYEALDTVMVPEGDDQEEYIDVSQANDAINNTTLDDSQEEYMDVQSPPLQGSDNIDEEPQEDYVEPTEIRSTLTNQKKSSSSLAPPLPPAPKQPLPPPPPPSQDPVPPTSAPPPVHRPDPPVDTSKIYIQSSNGIEYKNVYVVMWDFTGAANDELSVKRGDLVLVEKPQPEAEWWLGELVAQDCSRRLGQQGLFPANYCTIAFEVI